MKLQEKTIKKALESKDRNSVKAAVKNCATNRNLSSSLIEEWRKSDDVAKNAAAIYASSQSKSIANFREKLDQISKEYGYSFACEVLAKAYNRNHLWLIYPPEEFGEYYSKEIIKESIKLPISIKKVKEWMQSDKWYEQTSALYYCAKDPLFSPSYDILEIFDNTMDTNVMEAAIEAIRAKELPEIILQRIYDESGSITKKIMVTRLFYGRDDVHLNLNPDQLTEEEIKALAGANVDKKIIERWLKSSSPKARAAAIYLSKGKPFSPDFYKKITEQGNPLVNEAVAVVSFKLKGYQPVDQIKKDVVYKKCAGNVIVKCTMPNGVSTRETGKNQGRADRLFVEEIMGDFFGEKIGFSFYEPTFQYLEGKSVSVPNFDASFAENANGIHFFLEEKEAKKFYY